MMIFGFLRQNLKTEAVAVAFSIAWPEGAVEPGPGEAQGRVRLGAVRPRLYGCLTARADELAELADAVLCAGGPVRVLAELSLVAEHRRGHGALYDAVNCGGVDVARLRWSLAALPLPAWPDGRIRLAVDVSNWLRPDAVTSPERLFCHCYGRGKNSAQMIPGWPYSFVAALEPGRTSWTRLLDAVRLGPDDELTAVTAAQVRGVIGRLIAARHWRGVRAGARGGGGPGLRGVLGGGVGAGRAGIPAQGSARAGAGAAGLQPGAAAAPPRRASPARWAGRFVTGVNSSSLTRPPTM